MIKISDELDKAVTKEYAKRQCFYKLYQFKNSENNALYIQLANIIAKRQKADKK